MKITKVRIQHFRSIVDLQLDLSDINVVCGPNSSGKTNFLQALMFAFEKSIDQSDVYKNLPYSLRDQAGSPKLSIWIDLRIEDCPKLLARIAGYPKRTVLDYKFRAIRSGTVIRKLGNRVLSDDQFLILLSKLSIVYVPPIRDLAAGGIDPFKTALGHILGTARGSRTLKTVSNHAKQILIERAARLLDELSKSAKRILGVERIKLNTDSIDLDGLYEQVTLSAQTGKRTVSMDRLGTGHQSAIIINLYRQLGQMSNGETIYLFEEPDNHLHPTTIGTISEDLKDLSVASQVLLTTHSPVLLRNFDVSRVISLNFRESTGTVKRDVDVSGYTDKHIRSELLYYGVRAYEPLLCKQIVVVEGSSDAIVLANMIEIRSRRTCDELDISLVAADGKSKVVRICRLLNALGADWRAILDWDAVMSDELPSTKRGLSTIQGVAGQAAITLPKTLMSGANKRSRNSVKELDRIMSELQKGHPPISVYQNSQLKSLIDETKGLSATTERYLVNAL
ncbi:MAG: AAA family ATPase, partial [Desulfuromonadales bacterium]|nr:AAA family ATPase [Desulfuromonadales bacterium]